MSTLQSPVRAWGWRVAQLLIVAVFLHACWMLLRHIPYRIDLDVYRMGGQAWLQGSPLYGTGVSFQTQAGITLPFTYPPLAAIAFGPLALVPLSVGSVAITAVTLLLLVVSSWIVLTRLQVPQAWWLAVGVAGLAVWWLEPVQENFRFGQVNVILMTLVIADCVPRRTPWPRGLLVGLAIALKLTPAVFLLYFLLRRDGRAILTAVASFAGATLLAFALAWRDSVQYWTVTVHDTTRIGNPSFQTNQNVAGALARLGLTQSTQFGLWTAACLAVLALTVWAVRRVLAAPPDDVDSAPTVALICVALFGLVVSPVSWSHHWVWIVPTTLVLAVLAVRRRDVLLGLVCVAGVALTVWTPIQLLPEHQEAAASGWRQFFGMSYVWWALAVIAVCGLRCGSSSVNPPPSPASGPTAEQVQPAYRRARPS